MKCLFVIESVYIRMDETDSQEIVVDFGKICRLCLTGDGILISLFSTDSFFENKNKSIPDRIMDLMSIAVIKNDGFPSWICHNCLSQVDKCYEFFDMCRMSQATLNESYITALSEAGVNVVSMKEDNENIDNQIHKKSERKEISICWNIKEEQENDFNGVNSKDQANKQYCNDCAKEFITEHEFFIHRVSVHHDDLVTDSRKINEDTENGGLWNCDLCGAKFHNRNSIITHIRFKHLKTDEKQNLQLKKLIFCKYCGMSFTRKNIRRHFEVVHRMHKNLESDQRDFGSFDCRICYRPFMRHSSLRNHIEKFHDDNLKMMAEAENCEIVWNCGECDSVFLEEVYLMQHYGSKHSKYPIEVDALRSLKSKNLICSCGVISSNTFGALLHSIFYHSEENLKKGIFDCPGCDGTFVDINELKIHLISYHWFVSMSYDNECIFCDLTFYSNESLRYHLSENHQIRFEKNVFDDGKISKRKKDEESEEISEEEKLEKEKQVEVEVEVKVCHQNFVCEFCGEFFNTKQGIQNHGEDCKMSHICELCGRGYKTDNHLKRHVAEYHNTMSPTKCPLCPKVFPRKMNLHNHYKRRHLKQTKKFVCSYCGQSLKGKVALRSHEDRLHRNIRSYKCTECPEAFTTRSILRKHSQRHLTERPMLQCQYCEKKFSTISGIERHVKTHEGVKEFKCDFTMCGKCFYTKSELKRHVKFHTRDFKHVCPICNHKFMSPGELKKHSTKHTGERPFKCHLCSCAYARRDDKVKHLKRVHNLKVKRIYGKPLRKYSEDESNLVDTIVIDESCIENIPTSEEIVYSNINVSKIMCNKQISKDFNSSQEVDDFFNSVTEK